MTPPLLLGFTFLLGAAGAIETLAYQALIPELVLAWPSVPPWQAETPSVPFNREYSR